MLINRMNLILPSSPAFLFSLPYSHIGLLWNLLHYVLARFLKKPLMRSAHYFLIRRFSWPPIPSKFLYSLSVILHYAKKLGELLISNAAWFHSCNVYWLGWYCKGKERAALLREYRHSQFESTARVKPVCCKELWKHPNILRVIECQVVYFFI